MHNMEDRLQEVMSKCESNSWYDSNAVFSLAALTARGKSSLNNALHHKASSWPNDGESMFVSVTEFLLRICVESFSDPTQTVQLVQQKDPISCMEDQRICHVDITAK